MNDIFVYLQKLPPHINEFVAPCLEGYNIYIDERLDQAHMLKAYNHALEHIRSNDFEKFDVQQIEWDAHERR